MRSNSASFGRFLAVIKNIRFSDGKRVGNRANSGLGIEVGRGRRIGTCWEAKNIQFFCKLPSSWYV